MTSLKQRRLDELFDEEHGQEYEKRLDAFWLELVRANASMYVIDRVLQFPGHMLLSPGHQIFLPLLVRNFADTVLLVVVSALTDPDSRSLTFSTLKDWIVENCHRKVRPEVRAYLKNQATPDEISGLADRAKKLRNKLVAHLDRQHLLEAGARADVQITLLELRDLLEETNKLMSGLCFGHGRDMLPWQYSQLVEHPQGMDPRSDIEYLLDLLAKDSNVLRMPEERVQSWPGFAGNLKREDREAFNEWRARLGLTKVSFE